MELKNKLTYVQQYGTLMKTYGGEGKIVSNGFVWKKEFQPTPLSMTYKLKIKFIIKKRPKVFIESPKPLPLAKGAKRLPHTYDTNTQEICLYRPSYNEWNHSMLISNTIVHWAVLWMFYYESWLYSGKWLGGGHGSWDAIPKEED